MSAEVVTGVLGLELLKVDLAQVVSKWVGETEKNMEAVFQQTEDSHAAVAGAAMRVIPMALPKKESTPGR